MRKIKLLALSVALSILGFFGVVYIKNSPDSQSVSHKKASLPAEETITKCDLFDQTESDILAQTPGGKECYFSGCAGLF